MAYAVNKYFSLDKAEMNLLYSLHDVWQCVSQVLMWAKHHWVLLIKMFFEQLKIRKVIQESSTYK